MLVHITVCYTEDVINNNDASSKVDTCQEILLYFPTLRLNRGSLYWHLTKPSFMVPILFRTVDATHTSAEPVLINWSACNILFPQHMDRSATRTFSAWTDFYGVSFSLVESFAMIIAERNCELSGPDRVMLTLQVCFGNPPILKTLSVLLLRGHHGDFFWQALTLCVS